MIFLSSIMDTYQYLLGQTDEGTSLGIQEVNEGDYSDRRNQSPMQTERSDVMSLTRCNRGISRYHKNLDRSATTSGTHQNSFPKKTSCSGFFSSCWHPKKTRSDDHAQRVIVNDLQNSRLDPNLKTIETWLHRFEKPTILLRLENSLEEVKRNKISKESHENLSKSVDKELQKLSKTFHPDRAGDHECQSALNAVREVLKTLTAVFLENIFIDYKYEYFSRLDVSVLVNENERNNTIQTLLYKISVLSETKRMNIVGEIRKFLTESEKAVQSYFDGHKRDFEKNRDYALYHLRKNVEGYEKLKKECSILIEESRKENDSIREVVQKVVHQSSAEWSILRNLEQVARSSLQGNFEIFSVHKAMDEYYIMPFVDYINVLSMCNVLLMPQSSRFSPSLSKKDNGFCTDDDRNSFIEAYFLAYDVYRSKKRESVSNYNDVIQLRKTLGEIFEILKQDYRMDIYKEGKSNRAEMHEKLSDLRNILKDLEEKEKKFEERLSEYEMEWNESPELVAGYRQGKEESFKVGMTEQQKESEEDSSKFNAPLEGDENHCKMESKVSSESVVNYRQDKEERFKVGLTKRDKYSQQDSSKFNSPLDGEGNKSKMKRKMSSESVVNYGQDMEEICKVDMANRKKEREDSNKINSLSGGEESQHKMEWKDSEKSDVNYRQDAEEIFKEGLTKREKEDSCKFSSKGVEELQECKKEFSKNPSTEEKWAVVEGSEVVEEVGLDCVNEEYF